MSRSIRKTPSNLGPLILIGAGVLLFAIAGVMFFVRSQNRTPTATPAHSVEDTFAEIPRVQLAEAKAALDSWTAVFVDVRDFDSSAAGHIPGALFVPLAELDQRLRELNRSDWVITYCT